MSFDIEKRKHTRFGPIIIKVEFESGGVRGEGYLVNLSEGGAFLATDDQLLVGENVSLRFTLPWKLGEITAEARVKWRSNKASRKTEPMPPGAGLAFTHLPTEAEEKILAFTNKFSQLAAKIEEGA